MLESLHVKNLALIKDAELTLQDGLNVLSGETGAGKSLLLGSVNLALGARADAGLVRHNESFAYVELIFRVEDPELLGTLRELSVEPEDGRIIISRRIGDGRNQGRINGETVTGAQLKKVSELLIDIHGQHEHQSLLHEEKHLSVLDSFCKEQLAPAMEKYREAYRAYREKREAIKLMGGDDEERKRKLDFLAFEIDEITDADLKAGEEERLFEEHKKLSAGKLMTDSLTGVLENLREGASEALAESIRLLNPLLSVDGSLRPLYDEVNELFALLGDAVHDTESALNSVETDEERIGTLEERLNLLAALKRKYGGSEEEILKSLDRFRNEYLELRDFDENKERILEELSGEKDRLIAAAGELHRVRTEMGPVFSARLTESLRDLNFNSVRFETRVEETNHYSADGADRVTFLISTNPGEEPKELQKVVSGGELSRIMLAIKNLAADSDRIPTLIFDEIDTGISGKTAASVAVKMQEIAKDHQVICISHLPQIVAAADHNYLIEKSVVSGETVTGLEALEDEKALSELARLLGAGEETEAGLLNAREMKERMKRKHE